MCAVCLVTQSYLHLFIQNKRTIPSCPPHRAAVWKRGSSVHTKVKIVGITELHVSIYACVYL